MATNAPVADDDKEVAEDAIADLKKAKDEVETSQEADETSETEETSEESEDTEEDQKSESQDEESEEESKETTVEESSEFVKEFPHIKGDTPEDYARNLEIAYKNSTSEALRLKGLTEAKEDADIGEAEATLSAADLYIKQKQDEEITEAFSNFSKNFSQVRDPSEYARFVLEVQTLSRTILDSQKRLAPPKELYSKAAVILGWEPDESPPDSRDKLNTALKDSAATSKTLSATKKTSKSKVTDQMVAFNRILYPDKTDAEIREELEPYVK